MKQNKIVSIELNSFSSAFEETITEELWRSPGIRTDIFAVLVQMTLHAAIPGDAYKPARPC